MKRRVVRSTAVAIIVVVIFWAALASSQTAAQGQGREGQGAAPTVDSRIPEANALYVKGLEYLSKSNPRSGGTLANARVAVKLFQQAVKKDPQFALGYIGLADAWDCFGLSVPGSLPGYKVYPHQMAAALRAAQLDDKLPRAHSLLASLYFNNAYDWTNAEREFKRVIELTNSMSSHSRYATFLATQGRFDEAIAQVKQAEAIDASSVATSMNMLQICYWQHKDDLALEQGREALRKDPNFFVAHFFMGFAYVHKGHFEDAIREFKAATLRGDAGSLSALGYGYAMAGNKVETAKILEQLKHHSGAKNVPYRIAAIYLALGDKDRAVKLIAKDYRQRDNWSNRLNVDPVMDPLRDDPRFKEVLRKMNFQESFPGGSRS